MLKKTYSQFKIKGKVVGVYNPHFYDSGISNDKNWNKLQFGIKIKDNSIIYVQLMGIENKGNNKFRNYIIIDKMEINPYEAIEQLKSTLKEESVIVSGYIKYEEYNDEIQTNFNVNSIELSAEELDYFSHFTNEIIYDSITDTGVKGKIINKKNESFEIVEYEYMCDDAMKESIRKNIQSGQLLRIHGNILNEISLTIDDNCDSIISGQVVKGLSILGGSKMDIIYNIDELNVLMSMREQSKVKINTDTNEYGF